MRAVMWFDYVCPWAYLGRDRTTLMRTLGVEVTQLPFELHPEIPADGVPVRPGGRLAGVFAHIGDECASLGIPFNPPAVSRNSRLALETVEVVRLRWPDAFAALDQGLADAYWVEGRDVSDRAVVADLVAEAGAPVDEVATLVSEGVGAGELARAMTDARERGVTATPAWWVNDALLIPGAQPRETIERWITRLQARAAVGDAPET